MAQLKNQPVKKSLASKKASKPTLKNVLAQPFPRYWPELSEEQIQGLRTLLKDKISKISNFSPRTFGITLGLSSCIRLVKKGEAFCLLLSTEIQPKFVASQIIYSTLGKKNTSVFCLPNLQKVTKDFFNIQSLAVCFSHEIFEELKSWIRETQKLFPLPDKLNNYFGQVETKKDKMEIVSEGKVKPVTPENVDLSQIYINKKADGGRAFIPQNARNLNPVQIQTVFSDGFISLSDKSTTLNHAPMEVDCDEDIKEPEPPKKNRMKVTKKIEVNHENIVEEIEKHSKIVEYKKLSQPQVKKAKKKRKNKKLNPDPKPISAKNSIFNYISLTVNRIQKNPNKKKKQKNKKPKK